MSIVKPKSSNVVSGLHFNLARQHVYHGYFWAAGQAQANRLFWDAWIAAHSLSNSFVLDGATGGVFRWGPSGGQVYNGSEIAFDYDSESVPLGQVHHTAVALGTDENSALQIATFINGVLCKLTPFSGTRTARSGGTYGHLIVGNTESNTCDCTVYTLRGWEITCPTGDGNVHKPFIPERFTSADAGLATRNPDNLPQFLADYTAGTHLYPDLSPYGFHGGVIANPSVWHPGTPYRSKTSLEIGDFITPTDFPLPAKDGTTAGPWSRLGAPPTPTPLRSLTPPSTPGSARIFDSFSREDSTWAFQNSPGLGSTETGTLGTLSWTQKTTANATPTNGAIFGVQGGRAVVIWAEAGVAYVDNGSATMDVRVDRKVSSGNRGYCSAVARLSDGSNFLVATANYNSAGTGTVAIGKVEAGSYSSLWSAAGQAKGSWTTMRLVCSGTSVSLYLDGSLQQTITSSFNQSATKAGIYIGGTTSAECNFRADNFTVI